MSKFTTSPFRGSSKHGRWASAIHENFFECASNDPEVAQLWCYTDAYSYQAGETVRFFISTTAKQVDLELIRDGAKAETIFQQSVISAKFFETPDDCSVKGCGWGVAFELQIPNAWPSGGYIVRTRAEGLEHHHLILIRAKEPAPLLLLAATSTWTAYNDWGGSNHYEGITGPERNQFSPKLSTQRPFSRGFVTLPANAPRIPVRQILPPGAPPRYPHMEWAYATGYSKKYASAGWASYERHFARWAEANGYKFDIASQLDLHYGRIDLSRYRCVICIGHDEYWSWEMRDAVDTYIEQGGRAARFAGNFLWQIRLEDEGKTQVCYKYRSAEDPLLQTVEKKYSTTCWESAVINRPGATTFGLNALRGMYAGWGLCVPRGSGGYTVYRPEHWLFKGTDLFYGDVFGAEAKIFGYEVDGLDYVVRDGLPFPTEQSGAPEGLEILAMGLATLTEEHPDHPASSLFIGEDDLQFAAEALGQTSARDKERLKRGAGMIVSFEKGKGAVVNAGTCEWVAGLIAKDVWVEQITQNVLNRFVG